MSTRFGPASRTGPRTELSRLWLYRLGLSGTHAKYRVVPRSAIVAFDELETSVRSWTGEPPLEIFLRSLWQRHGAPSPGVVDGFLRVAAALDRLGPHAQPAEVNALVTEARRRARSRRRRPPTGQTSMEAAKRTVLALWLHACAPPSPLVSTPELVELGIGFVFRRIRQRSLKRPGPSGREPPRTTR